jgi:glycerophosphoryl diester phosphodiesterase
VSDLDHLYQGRALVLAHRGASGHAPQNTLAAFLLAAEMGADGIELDVHLSADGKVVVIHDDTVDATTDGHGRVSQMTLLELQALDAGNWFAPQFSGERIPTLEQVFDVVGHRLLINIEIKVEAGYHPIDQEFEIVRLIEDYQMTHRVIVSSFAPNSLRRVRKLNPYIPLGLLYNKPEPVFWPSLLKARQRGKRVHVWTVNDVQDMRHMRDLGVDAIITNYPDVLASVLVEE